MRQQLSLEDQGYAAFWAGDLHRAVAMFHNLDVPGCAMMRARAFTRLQLPKRVIDEYRRRDINTYDAREAAWLAFSAATSYAGLGEAGQANAALAVVEQLAKSPSRKIQLALYSGLRCSLRLASGDFDMARVCLPDALLHAEGLSRLSLPKTHQADRFFLLARAYDLAAWVHGLDASYDSQGLQFLRAVTTLSDARNPDRHAEALLTLNLASFTEGRPFAQGVEYLHARLHSFPWTMHTSEVELTIRRALSLNALLFQNEDTRSRAIPKFASNSLASRLGDYAPVLTFAQWDSSAEFLDHLRYCVSIAVDSDWKKFETQLPSLRLLAASLAPYAADVARKIAELFYERAGTLAKSVLGRLEPRDRKVDSFLDGSLAKAEGQFAIAVRRFSEVSSVVGPDQHFDAIAGIEKYTMTRIESDLNAARSFVQRYPTSSFSRRLSIAMSSLGSAEPGDFPYLGMYGSPTSVV